MEKKKKGGRSPAPSKGGNVDIQLSCAPIYTTSGDMSWSTPGFHTNGHSCLYVPDNDGTVVLFGGYNGSKRTADLFKLQNANHIGADDPSYPLDWEKVTLQGIRDRSGHGSFIRNGKLYVHAGYDSKHEVLYDMVEIDLDTYTTQTLEYTERLRNNQERRWHCFFLHDNKYIAHGGWNDSGSLDDLIVLNLDTMQWQQITPKGGKSRIAAVWPSARRWHTLTPLQEGSSSCLLFGGYNGSTTPLGDAYMLNLDTGSWSEASFKGKLPDARSRHTMTEIGSKQLMLIGGFRGTDETCKEIHILHTDDMSWTELPEKLTGPLFPIIRSGHSITKIDDNRLFISGGFIPDYLEPCYVLDVRKM